MKVKSKDIIIGVLSVLILLMGTGFAYLSSKLYINGTARFAKKWNVRIESITPIGNNSTTAISNDAKVLSPTTATFSTHFPNPGDYMEYALVVHNAGTIDAKLSSYNETIDGADNITFSNDAVIGEALNVNERKTIIIKAQYAEDADDTSDIISSYVLSLYYVQK